MIRIIIILAICLVLSQTKIVISNPLETNFTNNEIDYKYGNFGEIPYGKTISAELYIT